MVLAEPAGLVEVERNARALREERDDVVFGDVRGRRLEG
jgi:hypothetical protein